MRVAFLQFRLERVIAVETVRLRVWGYAGVLRVGLQHKEAGAVGRTLINIRDGGIGGHGVVQVIPQLLADRRRNVIIVAKLVAVQMHPVGAHIPDAERGIAGKLALDVEAPLRDVGVLTSAQEGPHDSPQELVVILLDGVEGRQIGGRSAGAQLEGRRLKRAVAGIPHIVRVRRAADGAVLVAERGADAVAVNQPEAAANYCFAIAERRPRKGQARSQAVLMGGKDVPVPVARRGEVIQPSGVGHIGIDAAEVEIGDVVVTLAEPTKEVVAQADIEREVGSNAEIVLAIEPPVIVGLPRGMIRTSAGALVHGTQQELCQPCSTLP